MLCREIEDCNLTWFEEPIFYQNHAGEAEIAVALTTAVASGETEYTRYGFRRILELRSADVLMPDLQRVGGVSEFIRVGHMPESHDIPVSSHLFPETSLQVLVAEGQAIVPERPGWGFTFNQDYVSHLERA